MRRFRVLPVFGAGDFKLQPVFAGDLAAVAIESARAASCITVDAIGPETFTYKEFLRAIAAGVGKKVVLVHVWPWLGVLMSKGVGMLKRDRLLTRDELKGLMQNRLRSEQAPNGPTKFSEWVRANRETLGRRYASELAWHFRWRGDGRG
jgi:NADH dehydrogenase